MGAYRLRFVIAGSDPEISRTVSIPDFASFYDLHSVIQSVMGWGGVHFFAFESDGRRIAFESPYGPDKEAERPHLVPISEFEGKPIDYAYDYGCDWHVLISWEGTEDRDGRKPVLLEWKNDAPPEDCGTMEDFYGILKAIDDPDSPEHEDAMAWSDQIGFEEEVVLNSLDTWGVQGVMQDGAEIVDPMVRATALMATLLVFEGSVYYDRDEEKLSYVSGSEVMTFGSEQFDGLLSEISREDIDAEPDRYIPVWDTIEEFRVEAAGRMNEILGLGLSRRPGESDDNFTERVSKAASKKGIDEKFAESYMNLLSEHTYEWAREYGFFFMKDSVATVLATSDPVALRGLGIDPSDVLSFEDYIKSMNPIWDGTDDFSSEDDDDVAAYVLKLTVRDSDPVIDRTVIVPSYASFYDLHVLIQDVMQWNNVHPHSFEADGDIIELPESADSDTDEMLLPVCTPIADYEGCPVDYSYDFGDDWHVTVTWQNTMDDCYSGHVELIDWNGGSPPEDCGGVWAYNEDAKTHAPDFDEKAVKEKLRSWRVQGVAKFGDEFVPEFVRIELITSALSAVDLEVVYDTEKALVLAVRKFKRKSKRRGSGDVPSILREDIEKEPDRYVVVWDTPASLIEEILMGFLEDRETPFERREGESVKLFALRVEESMDEGTIREWRSHCLQELSEMVCDWAEDNAFLFYDPPGSFSGATERAIRSLHKGDIDFDDSEAVDKFLNDYGAAFDR